jgi:hypothetical protein
MGLGLLLLLISTIHGYFTEVAITNERLVGRRGFMSRRAFEIMLRRISGAEFEQTPMGHLLNYSSVLIRVSGGKLVLDNLPNPQLFVDQLVNMIGFKEPEHEKPPVHEHPLSLPAVTEILKDAEDAVVTPHANVAKTRQQ